MSSTTGILIESYQSFQYGTNKSYITITNNSSNTIYYNLQSIYDCNICYTRTNNGGIIVINIPYSLIGSTCTCLSTLLKDSILLSYYLEGPDV